jgi:hypothetical protein
MAYALYSDTTTDFGKSYSGAAEVATIKFDTGPEQIDFLGDDDIRRDIINSVISGVQAKGGTVIRTQLYRDKSPTWETHWKLLITAKVPATVSQRAGMANHPVFWAAVLAISLLVIWLINKTLESVADIIWGPGGGANFLGIPWLGWVALAGIGAYIWTQNRKTSKGKRT